MMQSIVRAKHGGVKNPTESVIGIFNPIKKELLVGDFRKVFDKRHYHWFIQSFSQSLKYHKIIGMTLVLLLSNYFAHAKKDSTYKALSYYRLGIDISKPISALLNDQHQSFVFQSDVNYRPGVNLAMEGGFGSSKVNSNQLKYNSRNSFVAIGMDHPFFNEEFPGDKDNAFIGLRYGMAFVQRQPAYYSIQDPLWGTTNGVLPSKSFMTHWIELTGGFRLELKKNLFAGWNIRLRNIVNTKSLADAPPAYLAGYGRGDKNTAFDYNFYLLFGFGKR